jgi:hypothetical protein
MAARPDPAVRDVDLLKRLVDVLGRTTHRHIVSTGPRHGEYELAPNMWGEEFLPQTRVIPLVDLVITHGGNNTVTEAFHLAVTASPRRPGTSRQRVDIMMSPIIAERASQRLRVGPGGAVANRRIQPTLGCRANL